MRDTSSEPAPDRVTAAARAADLGRPLARAEAPRLKQPVAVILTVLLTIIPSGIAVLLSYELDLPGDVAGAIIVGLTFGVPVVSLLVLNRRSRRPGIYLFERGAVLNRPGRLGFEVLTWPNLFPYERVRTFGAGQSATPRDEWSLVIRDGRGKDVFTGFGADSIRLAEAIAEVELVHARSALSTGEPVRYGPFSVTTRDLVVDGRALPWTKVERVQLNGSSVQVFGSGPLARPVEHRPRRNTPHQRTLLALVGELAGGRSAL